MTLTVNINKQNRNGTCKMPSFQYNDKICDIHHANCIIVWLEYPQSRAFMRNDLVNEKR